GSRPGPWREGPSDDAPCGAPRVLGAPVARCGRAPAAWLATPEAAAARGEGLEALHERLPREVRPQLVAKHQLGVRALPQQVVRDPLLAAGADDQIGVVHVGRVEVGAEIVLGTTIKGSRRVEDLR